MIKTLNLDEHLEKPLERERNIRTNYYTKEEADAIPGYQEIDHEYEIRPDGSERRISHGIHGIQTYNHKTGNWEYHSQDYIKRYERK